MFRNLSARRTLLSQGIRCRLAAERRSSRLGPDDRPVFQPGRAVILTKLTRYQYEKRLLQAGTEGELIDYLSSKQSDYYGLVERHTTHYSGVDHICHILESIGIKTKVVQRFDLDSDLIDWADVIFTAGGDGTFLLAASKMQDQTKPLIGINTDPSRSEGHLCLPKNQYSAMGFQAAIDRLLSGNFKWKWRYRIRITMSGKHANDDPVELHNQQLEFPEERFSEHVKEHETFHHCPSMVSVPERVLPVLALNEVFMGEFLSSRVSYYELSLNESQGMKQKSSGITVCTGTGSSSWYFHINRVSPQSVAEILKLASEKFGCRVTLHPELVQDVTEEFHNVLRFDPSDPKMAYTVRDPVVNGIFQVPKPRGFVKKLRVHSRMWDACLVVDGGSSFKFNDGATATLEIHKEDALRTVAFE